ncbi:MAG: glycosyltransferase [Planctomycetota bacterium]
MSTPLDSSNDAAFANAPESRRISRVLMVCPELPSKSNPGSMAPAARQIESIRRLGIHTDIVDMRGIPKLKYALALRKIRSVAKRTDVIHAHFGFCGWLARIATIGISKPIVMSFMGDDLLGTPREDGTLERLSKVFVRWNLHLAKKMDQVIVKSQEMAEVINPTACTVVPNGVDLEKFRPIDSVRARQKVGLPKSGHLVLFPGNPDNPRKGHSLAKASVDRAAAVLGEPIDLIPLWNVDPWEVPYYMNACDLMLMTSFIEGSPNVVKEALACDVPVIGVDVGDVRQMLAGVQACSCCDRDPNLISREIVRTLQNHPPCDGREILIRRGLDLESVAERVHEIYKQAI